METDNTLVDTTLAMDNVCEKMHLRLSCKLFFFFGHIPACEPIVVNLG